MGCYLTDFLTSHSCTQKTHTNHSSIQLKRNVNYFCVFPVDLHDFLKRSLNARKYSFPARFNPVIKPPPQKLLSLYYPYNTLTTTKNTDVPFWLRLLKVIL